MITDLERIAGATVVGRDGGKIGKVEDLYMDEQTGRPEWAAVSTGLFGSKHALLPLSGAEQDAEGNLLVPFDKDTVKNAPHADPDQTLSAGEEAELFGYYGVPYPDEPAVAPRTASTGSTGDAMTRSEERLRVGTERHETGRVRLRKHVVTEHVETTVPVTHEEVRLEREPITDANRDAAMSGPEISEAEHEVTLHEERPVVAKEAVPVERVRLVPEAVTENEVVDEDIRKERIDTDD